MRDSVLIQVVAAVVEQAGAYLVAQRPFHKRHGGLWEFPGGKVQNGESLFEAAKRELAEELGVTAVAAGTVLFCKQDPDSPFVIEFLPVQIDGTPRALEHAKVLWADPATLQHLPLAPADAQFVAAVLSPETG